MSEQEPKAAFRIDADGDGLRVVLQGVLFFRDFPVANEIVEALDPRLIGIRRVSLDFGAVEWMDSHWLGFMMRIKHHAETRGIPVRITRVNSEIRRLFDIVKFNQVFDIESG